MEPEIEYEEYDEKEYIFDPGTTVIIEVSGGVVQDTTSPNGIEALVVDYDNNPDAAIDYYEVDGVRWGRVIWGEIQE